MNANRFRQTIQYVNQQKSLEKPSDEYGIGRWNSYQNMHFKLIKVKTKLDFISCVFYLRWMVEVNSEKGTQEGDGASRAYQDVLRKLER